ncbi:MAG: hypothetical protein KIT68_08405 [Phycisphaeraceae bacterium]|nr:hypothetical protein [Phycisphaeraceae bacterium]
MKTTRGISIGLVVVAAAAAGVVGLMIYQQQNRTVQEQASLDEAHKYRRELARELDKDEALRSVGLTLQNPTREGDAPSLIVDGKVPDQSALERLNALLQRRKPPIPFENTVKVAPPKAP